MCKALFLLCPTDCLESTINQVYYKSENYFYTSLGNSFNIDFKTLTYIKEIIAKHHIKNIYFVLSSDNKVILDALGGQFFSNIKGLEAFYNQIRIEQKHSKAIQLTDNNRYTIISYFLNYKIKELQFYFNSLHNNSVRIHGKIYSRCENNFFNIYSGLLCVKKHNLN